MENNNAIYNIDFIQKIKSEIVEKSYIEDIKYNIASKFRWKFIGDISEALSHILAGMSTVFAFAAGFFNYNLLSFIAGCLGILSILSLQFSSYAMKECKERTEQVNRIFKKLGIDEIPDITIDSALAKFTHLKNQPSTSIEI